MASSFDQGRFVKDNFTMRFAPVVSIAMVLVATHPHAWSQDLKDKARANGGRVTTNLDVQGVFASLNVVAESAEVIVRARIIGKDPRLTPDGQWVRTYFQFVPLAIFKDVLGITPVRATPQTTFPQVFFEPVGVVHVDGLEIRQTSNAGVSPPLTVGDEVILFLYWNEGARAFGLKYGSYGVLRIQGDTISEDMKNRRNLSGKSLRDVEAEIERLVRGLAGG